MTDKELMRYFQLFLKYEKRFTPKGKHAIIIEVRSYNPRYLWRKWRTSKIKYPGLEDV